MDNLKYGKIVEFVHLLITQSYLGKSDLNLVDATCGNGFDTLFLCSIAGQSGHVTAFDVQDQAVERTESLLSSNLSYKNFNIIKDSHEFINKYVSEKISACLFNLGYLPFSDKKITTNPVTTIKAIENLLPMLNDDGRIYITTYISHDSGHEIKEVNDFLINLNKSQYNVIHIRIINKEHFPPELFIVEKTEKNAW